MWRIAALALAVALLTASPAAARTIVLTAWGEGSVTVCTVKLFQKRPHLNSKWDVGGRTACSVPVQQSGQAWLPRTFSSTPDYAPPCSTFGKTCESAWFFIEGGDYDVQREMVHYDVALLAPRGQGWVGAPDECFGVGSDNLTCNFMGDFGTKLAQGVY